MMHYINANNQVMLKVIKYPSCFAINSAPGIIVNLQVGKVINIDDVATSKGRKDS